MKTIIKLFPILFVVQIGYSQQLVQNISDLYKLKENETQFIDKPLKDLLKEIKPEIKIAFPNNDPYFFYFMFITVEQLRKDEGTTEDNVSLFIYVKDFIDWNWTDRPIGREANWTKEDANKYGDMVVTRISIVN